MDNMFHTMVKPVKKAIRQFWNWYYNEIRDDVIKWLIYSWKAKNIADAKRVIADFYKNPEHYNSLEYQMWMLNWMMTMYQEMSYVFE